MAALGGYAEVFWRNVQASGAVPQISVIMGPTAGGAVYSPAMTDFIYMVRDTSFMYVTGPDVVKTVTSEIVTHEELGGAGTHTKVSAVADAAFDNDIDTLLEVRRLFDFLPLNADAKPPRVTPYDTIDAAGLTRSIRSSPTAPTSPTICAKWCCGSPTRAISSSCRREHAGNILTGFIRLDGETVGVVANQPLVLAGASTSIHPRRPRASSASATVSAFQS